ncbi:MAG: ribonuclease H [Gemmatimonadota bacterium]
MPTPPIAIVHLDESCLGNGREGDNPGGAGALVEVRIKAGIQRRDVTLHERASTNNRMALSGATAVLEVLGSKGIRVRILMISDSQYLIRGMREWVPGWIRRDWTRKGGPIENLERWQELVEAADLHDVQWTWVRGHAGHPKNEYANDLAVEAARNQASTPGAVESGFGAWLDAKQLKKRYTDYDPDAAFLALERRLAAGDQVGLIE